MLVCFPFRVGLAKNGAPLRSKDSEPRFLTCPNRDIRRHVAMAPALRWKLCIIYWHCMVFRCGIPAPHHGFAQGKKADPSFMQLHQLEKYGSISHLETNGPKNIENMEIQEWLWWSIGHPMHKRNLGTNIQTTLTRSRTSKGNERNHQPARVPFGNRNNAERGNGTSTVCTWLIIYLYIYIYHLPQFSM